MLYAHVIYNHTKEAAGPNTKVSPALLRLLHTFYVIYRKINDRWWGTGYLWEADDRTLMRGLRQDTYERLMTGYLGEADDRIPRRGEVSVWAFMCISVLQWTNSPFQNISYSCTQKCVDPSMLMFIVNVEQALFFS